MKNKRLVSVLSFFLSVLMLVGAMPLGVFAAGTPSGNAIPNYTELRGKFGMSADANGVMIYDDLEGYYKSSKKDVRLSTEYKTVADNGSGKNTVIATTYDECPYLYADYAIYFDESIEGTTVKVRYGLSMQDAVYYVDSATGKVVKGDKSPIELTANNHNTNHPDYNAGFGMVYGEDGKLEYTTRYYAKKGIIFYILNHRASERIGQEDDVSILKDYIDQGYLVVTVDFKASEGAVTPFIENALVSLRAMFDNCTTDAALKDLGVTTDTNFLYFLPEGCRLERDVWFWDPSIFAVSGSMERFREIWNTNVSCEAEVNAADPKKYDTLGLGSFDSVEEMIAELSKKDGTPVEYKQSMDIIYPSKPKYVVPLYVQEATLENREQNAQSYYTEISWTSFALNGYACMEYDHPYWPFQYRNEYAFNGSGGKYGLAPSSSNNARAAIRCAKYLAEDLGYSDTLVGAGGISKATIGLATLSVKNNKQLPQSSVTAFGVTYDTSVYEGDILVDGAVSKAIVQPFMYYDETCENEVSSDCTVTYNSSGGGMEMLFKSWASYEKVPMVLSCGVRDNYNCYSYWEDEVEWFRENAVNPFLPITQLDQGHTFPVGYDTEFGYYRPNAMIKFFDVYLKPDANRAPEVLWVTPLDGAKNVPVTGEWAAGPYTPFGGEPDSYYYDQAIQIRFVDAVDPASVNSGVSITAENGERVDGTWVASEHNALYTFEGEALEAGTRYTLHISDGVKSKNGVALAEERAVSFKTEGTYLVRTEADTYVSAVEPDKAFGSADVLKVSRTHTTLVSFKAENVIEAEKVLLRADATLDSALSVNVYVLADTLVDSAVTYNTLTTSAAWRDRVLLGTYEITDGELELDLTALAQMKLGNYVTLALVAAEAEKTTDRYVYHNDFETPVIGTAVMHNDIPVVAANGKVTDAIVPYTPAGGSSVTPWSSSIPASPFMWTRAGSISDGWLVKDANLSSSQIFRVWTKLDQGQKIKFFNTLTDDQVNGLTSEDVGKTFRVTFDIYPIRDLTLVMGAMSVMSTGFTGTTVSKAVKANTWNTVTYDITVTEAMVTAQEGLVAVQLMYPSEETTYNAYTYFDNLHVEEMILPHVYNNDFETPVIGTAVMHNNIPVVAADGKVTDALVPYTPAGGSSVTPWSSSIPASPFMWTRAGSISDGWLVKDANLSSSQIFRVWTKLDQGQKIKFFNTLTDDQVNGLTSEDVGKTFRVTFDIYPIRDLTLVMGAMSVMSTGFTGTTVSKAVKANTWNTVTYDITVTEAMVTAQEGLVAVQLMYPVEETDYKAYTYFDNLHVEEIPPSFEAKKGSLVLVTTNKGFALNADIKVMLDEAMTLEDITASAVVRNEATGKKVKGEWIAVGDDSKSFAFVTKGLEPATTYTVSLDGEVIRTVATEGSYALRPVATSYVSKSEPTGHFGLDTEPVLDGDKLGVVIFSAKTLWAADLATLYLDVETEKNTAVNVYALADITPDSTLCYNTVADKLSTASIVGSSNAVDGSKLAIDLSALADKDFGEYVTLVIKAGYRFFNDFETPRVTATTQITEGGDAAMPNQKEFYSDEYFWSRLGAMANGYFVPATATESQTFMVYTNRAQWIKFYNTLKTSAFDEQDIGREFDVSFKLHTDRRELSGFETVDDEEITLELGYTTRQNNVAYDGTQYHNITFADTQETRPTVTLSLIDGVWREVSFGVTVNEAMVALQAGSLTLQVPTLTPNNGNSLLTHYFDDMLVEEIVNYTVTLGGLMLMTENSASVAVTDSDNPVKDEGFDLPNVDASLISYQVTKGEDGVFSMRLVAGLDSLGYKCFGYEITLTTAEGTETVSGETTKVYDAIYGGDTLYSIKDNFGYKYAGLATVTELALDSESTELAVSAYVVTMDGEKLYGRSATLLYTGETDGEGYPVLTVK